MDAKKMMSQKRNERREKAREYFNTISNIPMLDLSHLVDESFYKTTYREDFVKKDRLREKRADKPTDFSIYSRPYDYKQLSEKLTERNKKNSNNQENDFSSDSTNTLTKSGYWYDSRDPETSGLFDSSTETRASFNGNFYVYKRPVIPAYVRRDHFYQTNSEKNLSFVTNEQGLLIPTVPDSYRKEDNRKPVDSPRKTMMDNFFLDKLTESQFSFTPKEQIVSPAKIMSHLKNDHMFSTNAARNVRYVKTNNGGLINYVPDPKFDSSSALLFNDPSLLSFNEPHQQDQKISSPYDNNHLKIKLRNPENSAKRNFSVLQKSFS